MIQNYTKNGIFISQKYLVDLKFKINKKNEKQLRKA